MLLVNKIINNFVLFQDVHRYIPRSWLSWLFVPKVWQQLSDIASQKRDFVSRKHDLGWCYSLQVKLFLNLRSFNFLLHYSPANNHQSWFTESLSHLRHNYFSSVTLIYGRKIFSLKTNIIIITTPPSTQRPDFNDLFKNFDWGITFGIQR